MSCTRIQPWMYCPQIAPPAGYECGDVNGVCTKVPTGSHIMFHRVRSQLSQIQDILNKLTASVANLHLAH